MRSSCVSNVLVISGLLLTSGILSTEAQAVSTSSSRESDSKSSPAQDDLVLAVDALSLLAFIFAGGPTEVVIRLTLTATAVVIVISVLMCCVHLGLYDPDEEPSNCARAVGWGRRGYTCYAVGDELVTNKHKWGL